MRTAIVLAASLMTSAAHAHIVFDAQQARPGTYHAAALRVGHGCEGSPTVALRVVIPAGITSAKPQPKPGWTIAVEREPLAQPIPTEGGGLQRERVKAVTWRGRLPDEQFDSFGLLLKLPAGSGVLAFPTTQTCERGARRWADVAPAGAAWNSVPSPAPVLRLEGPSDAHRH
jgi:hypothetical protein